MDKDSHHNGAATENKQKSKQQKFTYLFKIVISQAPRGASTSLSGHAAALLTATGRAEVGTVRTALGLCRLGGRWGRLALEGLHLLVKLSSELLVLLRELADAVLGNPVIPAVERQIVLAEFLVCPLYVGQCARPASSTGERFSSSDKV